MRAANGKKYLASKGVRPVLPVIESASLKWFDYRRLQEAPKYWSNEHPGRLREWRHSNIGMTLGKRRWCYSQEHNADGKRGSTPDPLEANGSDASVVGRMLGITVTEVILDQPQVIAAVGEREATRVP